MKFNILARKEPFIDDIRDILLRKYPDAYHGDKWVKIYDNEDNIRDSVNAELDLDNFKCDVDVYATIVTMSDHCIVYI